MHYQMMSELFRLLHQGSFLSKCNLNYICGFISIESIKFSTTECNDYIVILFYQAYTYLQVLQRLLVIHFYFCFICIKCFYNFPFFPVTSCYYFFFLKLRDHKLYLITRNNLHLSQLDFLIHSYVSTHFMVYFNYIQIQGIFNEKEIGDFYPLFVL